MRKYFFVVMSLLFSACQSDRGKFVEELPPQPDSTYLNSSKQVRFLNELIEQSKSETDTKTIASYYFKRASLYLTSEKENLALEDIQEAIKLDSTKGKYYFVLAQSYNQREEPQNVLPAVQKAIELGHRDLEVFRLYAYSAFYQKKWNNSLFAFKEITKRTPSTIQTLYHQGVIWNQKKDTTQAMPLLRQALQKDSTHLPSYIEIIKTYNQYGLHKEAWKEAQIAFQKTGISDATTFSSSNRLVSKFVYEYGNIYVGLKKRSEGVFWYRKAVEYDTTNLKAALLSGVYLVEKKYYPRASYYLKKVVEQEPKHSQANYLLGFLYEYKLFEPLDKLERFRIAKKYFEITYQNDSLNADYGESLRRINNKIEREEYKLTPEYAKKMRRWRQKERQRQDSINNLILQNPIF